ncbi:hypothetical protein [Halorubrum tebenquichense]|uniref:Uncharacterized protein n=1 Tax=Halorubrum tebenquichense DSM 14210 TaxID=1227485 RepID=M0DG35_9EURY|nr:hypothetical protein [Halorubrum tebenquichense]ELZ33687.1 hypothetical protein C472_13812 [Halorubrum tebenquichense DSM 14210]
MDESLHDALNVIAFLLAVIAAVGLTDLTVRYGPTGLMLAVLFLILLSVVGVALGPDRDRRVGGEPGGAGGDAP